MATLTPAGASAASEAVLSDPVNPSPSAPALDASALAADPSPPVVVLADASTPNGLSTTITKAALNRTIAARKPRTTDEELGALYAEKAKLNEELQKAENKIAPPDEETQPVEGWPHWRNELRMVMRVPTYSKLASFVAIWSFSTILTCIILMIITSRPSYRTEGELQEKVVAFWISFGLQVSFMTEMLLNWLSMKSLSEFFGFFNILDMVTILPFWIIFFVHLGQGVNPTGSEAGGLSLLRVLRLLRLTKVFKTRRSARIVLLAQAVKESTFGILALLVVFPLVAIFYGTFVYYVETASCIVDPTNGEWIYNVYPNTGTVSKFQSIDISLWFMTVTLTTVGYGDMVPLTPQGRFVACIAMVTALFLLAMPMTIITSSYGRVLDRFNAQTDQIKALKFRIRQIEWHICKLENRVYVDPFKIVRPGPSKVRQWFESFKVFFFGEKEKKPSKPPTGVSLTTGEPDAADLVDADAEKEGLEGDPDVEGGNNVDEMVRDLKSLVETKAKTDSDTRDRIVKLEENVAKMLSLLEKLDAAMPAA